MRQRLLQVVDGPLDLERAEHALRRRRGSSTRAIPKPIEPNSGLTMTSEPSSSNAASASSARSQATVRGVGTPAAASSAEARNLSTVRSIASAPLTARTPTAASACSASTRKTICSSEPRGIAAHDHDVARVERDLARRARRCRRRSGRPSASPARTRTSCPRAVSARSSRSACQPPVEPRTATRRLTARGGECGPDGPAMRTLLIDNYDSYTFNLFHLLGEVNGEEPIVVRNDELSWDELAALDPDNIVISPGPGRPEHPRDAGVSLEVLRRAEVPVLGVCLGHQALAYVCGRHDRARARGHARPPEPRSTTTTSALFAGHPAGLPRRPLPLARRRRGAAGAARDGLDAGRRGHGARASHAPAVRRAVPPRVRQHAARPRAAGELPRPRRPRAARGPARRPTEPAPPPGPDRAPGHVALARRASTPGASPRRSSAPCSPTTTTPSGSTAPAAGRASRGSRSSARPTGRSARSSATTSARGPSPSSARPAARSAPRACFDYCRRELAPPARGRARAAVRLRRRVRGLPRLRAQGRVRRPRHAHLAAARRRARCCATGCIAFDHRERRIHLVALTEADGRDDADAWLAATEQRLRALAREPPPLPPAARRAPAACASRSTTRPTPTSSNIAACRREIFEGESYEICLTTELRSDGDARPGARLPGAARPQPRAVRRAAAARRASRCSAPRPSGSCASTATRVVESRPMKGTAARLAEPMADAFRAAELRRDEKTRAENLMIADLVRNDLGRVSRLGHGRGPEADGRRVARDRPPDGHRRPRAACATTPTRSTASARRSPPAR